MKNKQLKKYRIVKEVTGTDMVDALKNSNLAEPIEICELDYGAEEELPTIGFKSE